MLPWIRFLSTRRKHSAVPRTTSASHVHRETDRKKWTFTSTCLERSRLVGFSLIIIHDTYYLPIFRLLRLVMFQEMGPPLSDIKEPVIDFLESISLSKSLSTHPPNLFLFYLGPSRRKICLSWSGDQGQRQYHRICEHSRYNLVLQTGKGPLVLVSALVLSTLKASAIQQKRK